MKPYVLGGFCRRGHKLTKRTMERFFCRNFGGYRHRCGVCAKTAQTAWANSPAGKASRKAAKTKYNRARGVYEGRRPPSMCVEGCEKRVQGFGLCAMHYQRWKYATDEEWRERTKKWQREKDIRGAPPHVVALFQKFYQLKKELQR